MQSAGANSLWRSGAKGFFRDQRARRVGDILTVQVSMADNASWSNQTSRSRKSDDHLGIPDFFGLQNLAVKALPEAIDGTPVDPDEFIEMDSQSRNNGRGSVNRAEEIRMNLAAVITQTVAQRQSRDPRPPGGAGQFRDARGGRGRHHPARGHHAARTRSRTRRSPSCASPMAGAARSPTCSSRATAPRRSTSCCPTDAGRSRSAPWLRTAALR